MSPFQGREWMGYPLNTGASPCAMLFDPFRVVWGRGIPDDRVKTLSFVI